MSVSSGVLTNSDNSMQQTASEDERLDMATQTGTSLQNATYPQDECSVDSGTEMYNNTPLVASSAMLNSPTTLCSLSTPPSSKNTSPSGSVLDVSIGHTTPVQFTPHHQEGGDSRSASITPLDQSRRSSLIHHTANSFAVIDDSSSCGRNTPPILLNHRTTPTFKEKTNTSTEARKYEKKDNLETSDPTHDTTEQRPGTPIRTPTEKVTMSKPPWDLLETLQPFTTNICRQCLGDLTGGSGKKSTDLESQLSPAQLLDHYLLFGQFLQQGKLKRCVVGRGPLRSGCGGGGGPPERWVWWGGAFWEVGVAGPPEVASAWRGGGKEDPQMKRKPTVH
jgi:hypothetical protein